MKLACLKAIAKLPHKLETLFYITAIKFVSSMAPTLGVTQLDEVSDKGLRIVTATAKEIKEVETEGE